MLRVLKSGGLGLGLELRIMLGLREVRGEKANDNDN